MKERKNKISHFLLCTECRFLHAGSGRDYFQEGTRVVKGQQRDEKAQAGQLDTEQRASIPPSLLM